VQWGGVEVVPLLFLPVILGSSRTTPARDPGVRGGTAAAGGPIAGLSASQQEYFSASAAEFSQVEGITHGLGPRMNLDSCSGCHQQPALGGSSPAVNPQVEFAGRLGGTDGIPAFLSANGPVREARFVLNADGTADGGVHALFTIAGRTGAAGCTLAQPDFDGALAAQNVIFRIPTPTFGAGLIEQIPDAAILANQAHNQSEKDAIGIRGRANFQVAGRTITGQSNDNSETGSAQFPAVAVDAYLERCGSRAANQRTVSAIDGPTTMRWTAQTDRNEG
jgi:hypothetical protein